LPSETFATPGDKGEGPAAKRWEGRRGEAPEGFRG